MASLKNILLDNTANKRKQMLISRYNIFSCMISWNLTTYRSVMPVKKASRMNGRERSRIWTESGVCTKPNWQINTKKEAKEASRMVASFYPNKSARRSICFLDSCPMFYKYITNVGNKSQRFVKTPSLFVLMLIVLLTLCVVQHIVRFTILKISEK